MAAPRAPRSDSAARRLPRHRPAASDRPRRAGMSRRVVGRLLSIFLRPGDLSGILLEFVRDLGETIGADRCGIVAGLPAEDGQEFIAADRIWSRSGVASLEGVRCPYRGQEIFESLRRDPETLVFEDSRSHPRLRPFRELLVRYHVSSAIVQPLVIAGVTRGILWPHRCGAPRPFSEGDVELVREVAAQAALGIDRARAYDRERRRNAQLQGLHRLQSGLARLGEPEELAVVAVEGIHEAMPDLAVAIGLVDAGRTGLVVRARAGEGIEEESVIPLDHPTSLAVEVARSGALRVVPGDPTRVALPIRAGQQNVGVLLLAARRTANFDADDVTTFEAVAAVLGVTLDNASLFERIEREKEEWATTFDAITDMLSVHDQDQRLLRGNRALLNRLQGPAYALTGRTCTELYGDIVGVPVECPHPEAERQGRPASREIESPGRGSFRLTALPRFRAGSAMYSVHVCEDVTEERRLREQLLQSEKMSAVGQLVSGVAHELNNPLAGVMGYTQLMLGRPLDSKMRLDLERVFEEAQRAARIVQNLLTFARKHKPEKRLLGMNGIIEKTLELRAYELRVSNITVETAFDPDLPCTMLDFHQMQQVILNILTNAEQAMLEAGGRGRLRIATRRLGDRIEVRIQDDGPGIAPEHLPRILEPFFTTKPVGQGTGLGLSICDGIVKGHGGRIAAESVQGQGATFLIELPVVAPDGPAAPEVEAAPSRAVTGGRILVVDDETSIQGLLVEVLTQDGFRVDTAGSGTTALAKIEKGGYDLIISDLKMPGMSGCELYEAIRARRPDLIDRVLFTSGDTASPATEEFLHRTGHRALLKPFTIEDLRVALGRFFSGPS